MPRSQPWLRSPLQHLLRFCNFRRRFRLSSPASQLRGLLNHHPLRRHAGGRDSLRMRKIRMFQWRKLSTSHLVRRMPAARAEAQPRTPGRREAREDSRRRSPSRPRTMPANHIAKPAAGNLAKLWIKGYRGRMTSSAMRAHWGSLASAFSSAEQGAAYKAAKITAINSSMCYSILAANKQDASILYDKLLEMQRDAVLVHRLSSGDCALRSGVTNLLRPLRLRMASARSTTLWEPWPLPRTSLTATLAPM